MNLAGSNWVSTNSEGKKFHVFSVQLAFAHVKIKTALGHSVEEVWPVRSSLVSEIAHEPRVSNRILLSLPTFDDERGPHNHDEAEDLVVAIVHLSEDERGKGSSLREG